jgi:molybdopterin-guanine dinucleotide biosynthesis protein A
MTFEASRQIVALLIARGSADRISMPGIKYKALLPINGRPMADYVLEALQDSKVERIFIVQAEDEKLDEIVAPHPKNFFVPCSCERPHMTDSLICGVEAILEYYGEIELSRRIIMSVPCDIPLTRSEDFDCLIRQCENTDADVFLTAIRSDMLEQSFPDRRYHSLHLGDLDAGYSPQNICFANGGRFTFEISRSGTRVLAIRDSDGKRIKSLNSMIEKLRKYRHGKLIWFLSAHYVLFDRLIKKGNLLTVIRTIINLFMNKLTKSGLQAVFSAAFNLEFRMLKSESPALSYDIDLPQDLEQAFDLDIPALADTGELDAIGST